MCGGTGDETGADETLRVAVDRGYFAVPRRATLNDVADERGVSDVEASRQIRHALADVLAERFDE